MLLNPAAWAPALARGIIHSFPVTQFNIATANGEMLIICKSWLVPRPSEPLHARGGRGSQSRFSRAQGPQELRVHICKRLWSACWVLGTTWGATRTTKTLVHSCDLEVSGPDALRPGPCSQVHLGSRCLCCHALAKPWASTAPGPIFVDLAFLPETIPKYQPPACRAEPDQQVLRTDSGKNRPAADAWSI